MFFCCGTLALLARLFFGFRLPFGFSDLICRLLMLLTSDVEYVLFDSLQPQPLRITVVERHLFVGVGLKFDELE